MVRTLPQNNNNANVARRRGGVQHANRRAATSQYKYSVNKSLNNRSNAPANATSGAQAGDGNAAVYTRQWLAEADKDKAPFPEDVLKTTFDPERLAKLVESVKKATETEVNESNRLLSDDYIYSVQITSHRAPHIPMHLSRIKLPNSLETADSDICIFVKDLKRGRKLDHEPTVKHYEQLLRTKKIERSITIIPINQLYNEFATFELRRKLTYLYDRFLVDRAVAAHVNAFLGTKLLNKGRTAIPIDLGADNLSDEIEQALRIVFYKHVNNGITQSVQVGRHSMADADIAGNIVELVGQLAVLHPGGTKNVYKLFLKPNVNVSVAVPLYVDLAKPKLETPAEVGPREKALAAAADTASTVLEKFDINKAGEVVPKVAKASADVAAASGADEEMDDGTGEADDAGLVAPPAPVVSSTPAQKPRTAAAKKGNSGGNNAGASAALSAPIAEEQLNNVILKNLKKLVPKLLATGGQQQQQNTGRVQKNQLNNANQQQQQRQNNPNNQNNNQQHLLQQPQQQRQNNQQQRNNQQQQLIGGGGYNNGPQQSLPQQQQRLNQNQNNRRNNNNQGGYQNSQLGGGNLGGNLGGGGGYMNQQLQQRNNNMGGGGGLNYGNQRPLNAVGGGLGLGGGNNQRSNFNGGNLGGGGGYGQMGGGGGGNWSNVGGLNNDPWGQRSQQY